MEQEDSCEAHSNSRDVHRNIFLIDFADSGHGDPLYDIVMLVGYCLEGHRVLAESFWAAYKRSFSKAWSEAGQSPESNWTLCHHQPGRMGPLPSDRHQGMAAMDEHGAPGDRMLFAAKEEEITKDSTQPSVATASDRSSLSYVAMCYALLMEECTMGNHISPLSSNGQQDVFHTIAQIQARLWGFLDF